MNKLTSTLSIAAVIAASGVAFQAGAAGNAATSDAGERPGVPGVELNVGDNASDRGLPGVEMNVGRDGDQDNIDTSTLGAGPDTRDGTLGSDMNTGQEAAPLIRADRG